MPIQGYVIKNTAKLNDLKRIIDNPRLFISEYFAQLVNDVDLESEILLIKRTNIYLLRFLKFGPYMFHKLYHNKSLCKLHHNKSLMTGILGEGLYDKINM